MAKDDETGVDPKAKDGEPGDEPGNVASLEGARGRRGRGISDRAETDPPKGEGEGGTDEEDDGQFAFVTEEKGKRITLGTLIARGTPVEHRISMGAKGNVLKGALLDPTDSNHLLLVRGVVGDVNVAFTRDAEEVITKATVTVTIKPKTVLNARSEQAQVLMGGEPPSSAASG